MRRSFFIVVLFLIIAVAGVAQGAEPSDTLVTALIQVESSGNNRAVGDKHLKQKAYGPLQVRQPVCDDINRRYGTSYKAEDCLGNRELSIKLCKQYIDMYATAKRLGHTPTNEDMARIWNGGPNGFKKVSTEKYWEKVQTVLTE